jgi:hypothetical protein
MKRLAKGIKTITLSYYVVIHKNNPVFTHQFTTITFYTSLAACALIMG